MVAITMNGSDILYVIVLPNNSKMKAQKLLICEPDILTWNSKAENSPFLKVSNILCDILNNAAYPHLGRPVIITQMV